MKRVFQVPGSKFRVRVRGSGFRVRILPLRASPFAHFRQGQLRIPAYCRPHAAALDVLVGRVMTVRRFTQLRAWQTCDSYKRRGYKLCRETRIATDFKLKGQLEEAVARPSLMESQNHLLDAHEKGYIDDGLLQTHDQLAESALREVTELITYLQSPEASKNANRNRREAIERRHANKSRKK
jgi:hypothetical protein